MGPIIKLNEYIRSVRKKPFEWGKHDCLTFSNDAFRAFHGFGYADDWLGRYIKDGKPLLPSQMRVEFGAIDFDEAVEVKLEPISYVPPRGALVATKKIDGWYIGYGLGISMGSKAAFISKWGVVYSSLDDVVKAWVPR
jgi:hypothetical protein